MKKRLQTFRPLSFRHTLLLLTSVSSMALLEGCALSQLRNPFSSGRKEQVIEGERHVPYYNQQTGAMAPEAPPHVIPPLAAAAVEPMPVAPVTPAPAVRKPIPGNPPFGVMPAPAHEEVAAPVVDSGDKMTADNGASVRARKLYEMRHKKTSASSPPPWKLRDAPPNVGGVPEHENHEDMEVQESKESPAWAERWVGKQETLAETHSDAAPVEQRPMEAEQNAPYPNLSSVPQTPGEFKAAKENHQPAVDDLRNEHDAAQQDKRALDSEPSQQQQNVTPVEMPKQPEPQPVEQAAPQQSYVTPAQPANDDMSHAPRRGIDIMTQEQWEALQKGKQPMSNDMQSMPQSPADAPYQQSVPPDETQDNAAPEQSHSKPHQPYWWQGWGNSRPESPQAQPAEKPAEKPESALPVAAKPVAAAEPVAPEVVSDAVKEDLANAKLQPQEVLAQQSAEPDPEPVTEAKKELSPERKRPFLASIFGGMDDRDSKTQSQSKPESVATDVEPKDADVADAAADKTTEETPEKATAQTDEKPVEAVAQKTEEKSEPVEAASKEDAPAVVVASEPEAVHEQEVVSSTPGTSNRPFFSRLFSTPAAKAEHAEDKQAVAQDAAEPADEKKEAQAKPEEKPAEEKQEAKSETSARVSPVRWLKSLVSHKPAHASEESKDSADAMNKAAESAAAQSPAAGESAPKAELLGQMSQPLLPDASPSAGEQAKEPEKPADAAAVEPEDKNTAVEVPQAEPVADTAMKTEEKPAASEDQAQSEPAAEKEATKETATESTKPLPSITEASAPVMSVSSDVAGDAGKGGALPSPKILQEIKMLPPSRYSARAKALQTHTDEY